MTAVASSAKFWTREAILDAIRSYHAEHGYPPTTGLWKRAGYGYPHALTAIRTFDGLPFREIVRLAGLEPGRRGPRRVWTHERIVEAMLDWLAREGRWPTESDWAHGCETYPSEGIVRRRFGSWNAAKLKAGWQGSCPVCAGTFKLNRGDQVYCSRACRNAASRRRQAGKPIADPVVRAFPEGCAGCGSDLDVYTLGCKTCIDRRAGRVKRARDRARKFAPAGLPLTGSIEPPENGSPLGGGVPFVSTEGGEADAPAVERRWAA